MKYLTINDLKVKTLQGEIQIKSGQIISLPPVKGGELIREGKIKPFCNFLETIIPDCQSQFPCYEDKEGVIHECKHFKMWWRNREKQLIEEGAFKC